MACRKQAQAAGHAHQPVGQAQQAAPVGWLRVRRFLAKAGRPSRAESGSGACLCLCPRRSLRTEGLHVCMACRYGANEMRIPVKSLPMLIFEEMWHPFYCFQAGSGQMRMGMRMGTTHNQTAASCAPNTLWGLQHFAMPTPRPCHMRLSFRPATATACLSTSTPPLYVHCSTRRY